MAPPHLVRRTTAPQHEVIQHIRACFAGERGGVRLEDPSGSTFSLILRPQPPETAEAWLSAIVRDGPAGSVIVARYRGARVRDDERFAWLVLGFAAVVLSLGVIQASAVGLVGGGLALLASSVWLARRKVAATVSPERFTALSGALDDVLTPLQLPQSPYRGELVPAPAPSQPTEPPIPRLPALRPTDDPWRRDIEVTASPATVLERLRAAFPADADATRAPARMTRATASGCDLVQTKFNPEDPLVRVHLVFVPIDDGTRIEVRWDRRLLQRRSLLPLLPMALVAVTQLITAPVLGMFLLLALWLVLFYRGGQTASDFEQLVEQLRVPIYPLERAPPPAPPQA